MEFLPSFLDVLVVGLLGFAGWKGYKRGALLEAFSFATMIVGIYLASRFSDLVASGLSIRAQGKDFSYLPVMLFGLLFGGLIYLAFIVRRTVGPQVESIEKNKASHILGAVFSFVHMFLLIGVIAIMLKAADYNFRVIPAFEHKHSYLFKPVVSVMTGLFPSLDYVGEVDEDKVKDDLEENDQTKKVIDN